MTTDDKPREPVKFWATTPEEVRDYHFNQVENLLEERDALKEERDKWKDEYENLCEFATDFQSERDFLKAENEKLKLVIGTQPLQAMRQVQAERDTLKAKLERYIAFEMAFSEMRFYLRHERGCAVKYVDQECTCGFHDKNLNLNKALSRIAEGEK